VGLRLRLAGARRVGDSCITMLLLLLLRLLRGWPVAPPHPPALISWGGAGGRWGADLAES
jgi:hypothetical protein